ncbi:MAG: tetratricopeptide repeat protein [Thermoanaerobaculaceae bacterium]
MPSEPGSSSGPTPSLKTLLVCDLVGSTQLVEQVGDALAAEVFTRHDRVARDLVRELGGREIDKTDGFLLLLERPVDAVRFAVRYHAALAAIGRELRVALAARVGIHLGEVILRANPAADVALGAKPLEVEGLAKPVAARLMSLALGGQTLLTRAAFDIARRAVVGSESDAAELQWLAHGSYLLKGVEQPVEVFEVGVAGQAPLAPPPDSEKAKRMVGDPTILGWRPAPGQAVPRRPHWVLERKLGEGGFGEVWLSAHAKTHEQRVFKFCFEAERLRSLQREVTLFRLLKEALGDRPDIARILDWSFEQAPYFIESEYTAGGSLVEWAEEQGGVGQVPLAQRLEIVACVAEALAAAHSVGVLHKDVKPANVLIARGAGGTLQPKLTDFGIGLVTSGERLAEAGITMLGFTETLGADQLSSGGTRLYLAPELVEGKPASVQADVFALGVVLYQLVAGDLGRSVAPGWERDVEDGLLREDIAALVDGSPQRRLADVGELARRLRRLEERRAERERERRERDEAARARLALEKARRRLLAAGLGAAALLVAAAGIAFHAVQIAREKARAEREAETARRVSEFVTSIFRLAEPSEARGNAVTARELLDQGAARVGRELAAEPVIQARMLATMGRAYVSLGLYEKGRELYRRSLEVRERELGSDHPEVAESLVWLARAELESGNATEAEQLARRAEKLRRAAPGDERGEVGDALRTVAAALGAQGKHDEAAATFEAAVTTLEKALGSEAPELAGALSNYGQLRWRAGQLPEAEKLLLRALAIREKALGPDSLETAQTLNLLSALYTDLDRTADAERAARRCLEVQEKVLGSDHPDLAFTLANVARTASSAGRQQEAESLYRRALELAERRLGPDHPQTIVVLTNLSDVLTATGRLRDAEPLLGRAAAAAEKAHGPNHPHVGAILLNLGEVQDKQGRRRDAEASFRRAVGIFERAFPKPHPWTAMGLGYLAGLLRETGRSTEAAPLFERAIGICDATLGPSHPQCVSLRKGRG